MKHFLSLMLQAMRASLLKQLGFIGRLGFTAWAGFEGLGFGLVQPKSIVEPRSLKRDDLINFEL